MIHRQEVISLSPAERATMRVFVVNLDPWLRRQYEFHAYVSCACQRNDQEMYGDDAIQRQGFRQRRASVLNENSMVRNARIAETETITPEVSGKKWFKATEIGGRSPPWYGFGSNEFVGLDTTIRMLTLQKAGLRCKRR